MKFTDLNLHPSILSAINKNNFLECTPIQESAIPSLLDTKDVAGLAQTGTGKTAAYLIPLMDRILWSLEKGELEEDYKKRIFPDWKKGQFVLILVPTRELAEQVSENIISLAQDSGLQSVAIYGGTSYEPQKKAINQGVHFVVATPGRLIDLYKEHVVELNQVRAIVFDEADRMFDMGFKDDMKYILKRIPQDRQFLVFSATLNFDVLNVAYEFGSNPVEVNVSRDQAKAENVRDEIFHVGHHEKPQHLLSLLRKHNPNQAIIFSNFKSNVEKIATFLSKNNIPAMGISSLLTQPQRTRVMEQFKAAGNDRNILVATDVAARGLDVKGVDLVINYDLPDDPENYIHRIGRTGRAGEEGLAFSLSSDRDVGALSRIFDYLGHKVPNGWLDDTDLITSFVEFAKDTPYRKVKVDARGSNNRSSRRPKNNNRPQQRTDHQKPKSRQRTEKPISAETAKVAIPAEANATHRDRLSGRHQQKKNEKDKVAVAKKAASKKGKRRSYNKNSKRERFDPNKRKSVKATGHKKTNAPQSVGQKVSSFIKKLFH